MVNGKMKNGSSTLDMILEKVKQVHQRITKACCEVCLSTPTLERSFLEKISLTNRVPINLDQDHRSMIGAYCHCGYGTTLSHPQETLWRERLRQPESLLQSPLVGSPSLLFLLASFQTRLQSEVVFQLDSKYSASFGTRHRSSAY